MVDKLDKYLGFPEVDPHGDIIPDSKGEFKIQFKRTLADVAVGQSCKMVAVKDNSVSFLQYVVKVGLGINNLITVLSRESYDSLIEIRVNGHKSNVSQRFAQNIFVVCQICEPGKACPKTKCEIKI